MAREIERMSFRDLQELELRVQKAKVIAQDRTRAEVRERLEKIAADAGFKIDDLFGTRGGKGRKVAAKYVNPENLAETWTGRGRKPRWLAAKLRAGEKLEKYLIK